MIVAPRATRSAADTATGAGYGIGAAKGITGGRKGYKAALFEGGVGVPFIARWPGKIKPDSISDQTICLTDIMATAAAITGAKIPNNAAEDSFNILSWILTYFYMV